MVRRTSKQKAVVSFLRNRMSNTIQQFGIVIVTSNRTPSEMKYEKVDVFLIRWDFRVRSSHSAGFSPSAFPRVSGGVLGGFGRPT